MSSTQAQDTSSLALQVNELRSKQGLVHFALFSSSEGFPTDTSKALKTGRAPVSEVPLTITIEDLPYGHYAVTLYHDENSNNEFDTGAFGFPKEGFGFSDDPKVWKGAPKFQQAEFEFTAENSVVEITMKYM
ncbi:MAG: DUF2141 domain-containing protein [Chroococcidiopsidaceae cyanobacterium CP_BM_ER_R8_30]|nr:DUF2141 domain-containing protein [Chroococcidiopsidaceae cyanobacterium CP_BM_ER_R8_30]